MFSRFSEEAQKALILAKKEMNNLRHPYVGSEHLFLSILSMRNLEITKVLSSYNITYEVFKKELIRIVKNKDGIISVDRSGKAHGRGAYICDNVECLEKAIKSKRLDRAFGTKISDEIYESLRGVIIGKW